MPIYLVMLIPKDGSQDNARFREAIEKWPATYNDGWNYIALSDFSYLAETTLPPSSIRTQLGLSMTKPGDELYIFTLYGPFHVEGNDRAKQWLEHRQEQIGRGRSTHQVR
jgi:hypothetical protein